MALRNNPFIWVSPLVHMARVKTVEFLWRKTSASILEIKNFYANGEFGQFSQALIISHLEGYVDRLIIPEAMKDELKVYVIEMVNVAVIWLENTRKYLKGVHRVHENYTEMYAHFIDNFSWNSIGYVDGRTILKSYVSNKETIDFPTWKLLCAYCIEDDIIRFTKTMNWENCRNFVNSSLCIYWYREIQGFFPTKDMFSSVEEYSDLEDCNKRGVYGYAGNFIFWNMLRYSATCPDFPASFWAVKYFRNKLNDEEHFRKLYANRGILRSSPNTICYLFGEMKDMTWVQNIWAAHYLFEFLGEWPWILFIDHWIEVFEGEEVVAEHFVKVVGTLAARMNRARMMEETKMIPYRAMYDKMYHPIEELYTIYNRRFGADWDAARWMFNEIYPLEHMNFFRLLFTGLRSRQGKWFLEIMRGWAKHRVMRELGSRQFNKLMEEVLGDEDKKRFRKIVRNRRFKE